LSVPRDWRHGWPGNESTPVPRVLGWSRIPDWAPRRSGAGRGAANSNQEWKCQLLPRGRTGPNSSPGRDTHGRLMTDRTARTEPDGKPPYGHPTHLPGRGRRLPLGGRPVAASARLSGLAWSAPSADPRPAGTGAQQPPLFLPMVTPTKLSPPTGWSSLTAACADARIPLDSPWLAQARVGAGLPVHPMRPHYPQNPWRSQRG
jgi:hypothetical protein